MQFIFGVRKVLGLWA